MHDNAVGRVDRSLCVTVLLAGLIGELEATKLQKTAQVEELTQKLEELQSRLAKLQAEKSSLQSQQQSLTSEQQSHLTKLNQVSAW